MTPKETVQALIDLNIASLSDITATETREVLTAMLNLSDNNVKSKRLTIDTITTNHCHTVATALPSNATILGVNAFLECKVAVNGFNVGDIVTAPTPYPKDQGRTNRQGVGVQWNGYTNIRVMIADEITIMNAYVSEATTGTYQFNGAATANWKVVLIVNYILT